jgi:hypothetical protein
MVQLDPDNAGDRFQVGGLGKVAMCTDQHAATPGHHGVAMRSANDAAMVMLSVTAKTNYRLTI